MDESLRQAVALLAVAIIVAIAARQFRLPYTVGLVIVGALLTLSKPDFGLHLTHDLIFDLIPPPLLFEAALSIPWRELRRDYFPITVLATLGAVIAACVVTEGMVWLLGLARALGAGVRRADSRNRSRGDHCHVQGQQVQGAAVPPR